MLILRRTEGQTIEIGPNIVIEVQSITPKRVKLAIFAPTHSRSAGQMQ